VLYRELGLPGGVTAFVGGGGKTTLIGVLARELAARHTVLIATTTHIYPPACPVLISPTAREVLSAFEDERTVAVGSEAEDGKLGALPELQRLYPVLADAALVEADGARRLPLKAPAEHEPVIPREARLVVAVLGLDGIGKPIAEAAHRPELYAALVGKPVTDAVTPEDAALVLMSTEGQMKNVACPFAVVLNKADTPERMDAARKIAEKLPCTALITALAREDDPIEVWRNGKCSC